MIDLAQAQAQMDRMTGLEFPARGREQRLEVLNAMRQAHTLEILTAAVSRWIETSAKFPKPSEIGGIVAGLNVAHDQAIEAERRRRDWDAAKAEAKSPAGRTAAERDLAELRGLFERRLASVDQRYAGASPKERDCVRGQIRKVLTTLEAGGRHQQLVDTIADRRIDPAVERKHIPPLQGDAPGMG